VTIQRPHPHDAEDEQPDQQRRRGKPGVPVWVWLVCGGFGAFLLLACGCGGVTLVWFQVWVQGHTNAQVTEENYNKLLRLGMTKVEVKAVMGEPNATAEGYKDRSESGDDPRDYGGSLMRWRNGAEYITVTFGADGKSTGVGYQFSDRGH
jgi:hypothetical protein